MPCKSDPDCVSGSYCYCGNCSSSFTSAGCPNGQCCNRGYFGSSVGQCENSGTTKILVLCHTYVTLQNEF
jgi:hypothetical protein